MSCSTVPDSSCFRSCTKALKCALSRQSDRDKHPRVSKENMTSDHMICFHDSWNLGIEPGRHGRMLHNGTCMHGTMCPQKPSTNAKIYEHEHWTCFEGCRAVDHPLVGRWPIES
jgi:hypothetical protein